MPKLKSALPLPPSTPHTHDPHHQNIYQLCACANGKLFLAPPHGACAAREESLICRWWIFLWHVYILLFIDASYFFLSLISLSYSKTLLSYTYYISFSGCESRFRDINVVRWIHYACWNVKLKSQVNFITVITLK